MQTEVSKRSEWNLLPGVRLPLVNNYTPGRGKIAPRNVNNYVIN